MQEKIKIKEDIPLIGCIAFGIIDRGINLIQIRPTTLCPLNCIFCSTDSGIKSKSHKINYEVDSNHLIKWVESYFSLFPEKNIAYLDSVGETMSHKDIFKIIKQIKQIPQVKKVALETNGYYLNNKTIKQLKEARLDQINLSIHSLNQKLSQHLTGSETYSIDKIKHAVEEIIKNKIKLIIGPVWIKGVNDKDIEELIQYSKNKKLTLGIQKYEAHKRGRKIKAKPMQWKEFYTHLKKLEKKYNKQLILDKSDFEIKKVKSPEPAFKINEKINVDIKCKGWFKNQMIGSAKNRCITILNCYKTKGKAKVKIISNQHEIYLAELIE